MKRNATKLLGGSSIFILHIVFLSLFPSDIFTNAANCNWPVTDTLFILDSTINVGGQANHHKILEFLSDTAKIILATRGDQRSAADRHTSLAVVQFTPEAIYEFGFLQDESFERVDRRIENIPYLPCLKTDYCQKTATSWNNIVEWMSSTEEGNRATVPDIIVLVTTNLYQLQELRAGEMLVRPKSPIHVFIVSIGSTMPIESALKPLEFAATTVHLAVVDFESLKELTGPLCESIQSFLGDDVSRTTARHWLSGPVCILCMSLLAIAALIIVIMLIYVIYSFRQDADRLRLQMVREKENLQKQDEYFKGKLRERSEHEKERERTMIDLINESNRMRDHYRDENLKREASSGNLKVPLPFHRQRIGPTSLVVPAIGRKAVTRRRAGGEDSQQLGERRNSDPNGQLNEEEAIQQQSSLSNGALNYLPRDNPHQHHQLVAEEDDAFLLEHSFTHLHHEHPALELPPVDVLLLVDASGSIGNANFELIKRHLSDFSADIDIAPGRSRIATILFAKEPHVFFDFDHFYTNRSVRAALRRLPYLGGPTFLAKALSFAAGILWQEQNMKEVRHQHRFLPTPHHDRLQVMIVVSDGVSDDDFDREATHLHEKMLVKIAAVVTKTFNRERLRPVTRYDGSIFMLNEKEALSIWLWNAQKMWNENFGGYVEREKTFHAAEKSFNINDNPENNGAETNAGAVDNPDVATTITTKNNESPSKKSKRRKWRLRKNVEEKDQPDIAEDVK